MAWTLRPTLIIAVLFVASWSYGQEPTSAAKEIDSLKRENERLQGEVERLTKQIRSASQGQQEFLKTFAWAYPAFTSAFDDSDPAVRKWAVKTLMRHCPDATRVKTHLDGLTSKEKDQSVLDVAVKAYNEFLEKQKEGQPDKPQ